MNNLCFIDTEVEQSTNKLIDIGAICEDGRSCHTKSIKEFAELIKDCNFICGHNIVEFDSKYISKHLLNKNYSFIDTLCISPIIYPKKLHHNLLKDDKLFFDDLNNPLNDAIKAKDLFYCELSAFNNFDESFKSILGTLLYDKEEFEGFFKYVKWEKSANLEDLIENYFEGKICTTDKIDFLVQSAPVALAYVLALVNSGEKTDIVSKWVEHKYKNIDIVIKMLRGVSCHSCLYCKTKLSPKIRLKEVFGYDDFRKYDGQSLQEDAVTAALNGKSVLAVFPTGGGKSITFQLPALIEGEALKGLTVVISPLVSLMKDQVDNLSKKGIIDAVTINGLLNPAERQEVVERVLSGKASLLYLSPETLRSKTLESMLLARNVTRIVIDEAHCFSSWGQDFRVDYLYIATFIKNLQEKKGNGYKIPVSCFTATAKQKVISDIKDYFKENLSIDLELFATNAQRKNLRYKVELKETDDEKYASLRDLLHDRDCPAIIYSSRTGEVESLARKLVSDGFNATYFHGKLDNNVKIENQEAFLNNEKNIMVATSAFGMGVDKPDVKLVVHYEISDSLENYVQEAGRAGRDQSLQAECIVYFNENDLDKHFMLLNQTKLSMDEIKQVWKAIKNLTQRNSTIYCSPLELARASGWDDDIVDIETRVKSAVAALEHAGYVTRGFNSPRIFATSINVKSVDVARIKINQSSLFSESEKENAVRIISSLISSKNTYKSRNDDAESRVDYLADRLGMKKLDVISLIDKMREERLLADSSDMVAYIKNDEEHKINTLIENYFNLERYLIKFLPEQRSLINLKELNEGAMADGVKKPTIKKIKTILFFWAIKGYIKKTLKVTDDSYDYSPIISKKQLEDNSENKFDISSFVFEYLYDRCTNKSEVNAISFSMVELLEAKNDSLGLLSEKKITMEELQNALLYLSKIEAINLEGGFLVLYNAMQIERLEKKNNIYYKNEDYKMLSEHYDLKVQQVHIVGQYANMMVNNYDEALEYVNDYFQMQYD